MYNDFDSIIDENILRVLLQDQTIKENIIWATDNYSNLGLGFDKDDHITLDTLYVIKPRREKSKIEQAKRTKGKAEVFTPSWICNEMNNNIAEQQFGTKNVFNFEKDKGWITNLNKIPFHCVDGKDWVGYIRSKVLEITCGEAPYLVSRYDTTTGEWIDTFDRIGLLDRKLRVVNENCANGDGWFEWVVEAYKATYGYEYQGDNLFLARKNLLLTFVDNYWNRYGNLPKKEKLLKIANIISWNIWQMDGLKCVVPNSCKQTNIGQISLFEENKTYECVGCLKNDNSKHIGMYCNIKDWSTNQIVRFFDMV